MQLAKSISFVPVLLAALATASEAQQPQGVGQSRATEGIYLSVSGGGTFGPQTSTLLAGEFGDRIHRNVDAYVTLSYHENLMDRNFQDDLTSLGDALTEVTNTPWQLSGRDRGVV